MRLFPVVCVALAVVAAIFPGCSSRAQEPAAAKKAGAEPLIPLDTFRPRPTLKVEEHLLTRARIPVVDVHVHPSVRLHNSPEQLDDYVKVMDAQNIAVCVSLDGGLGERLAQHRKYLWTKYRQRFVIFANIDWRGDGQQNDPASWDCQRPDFARRIVAALTDAKEQGASGLKVFKNLGLEYRNPDGSLVRVDDPRWDPIWEACGKLGFPVLIHTADPVAFFLPVDATNERYEELARHPDWSFAGPGFPTHAELVGQLLAIVGRHRGTTFIGAHMASNAEDLSAVASWLEANPNLNVDIAARIAELGRQPTTARKFFLKYADRILFATDGPRVAERLHYHWRFLETADEYFPYAENAFPPQGFWRIYGVDLPDEVLQKVYNENAARLIPGVKERLTELATAPAGK